MKPHLKRYWCISKIDSRFIAQMERILALYALTYDPRHPVLCYDKCPYHHIGDLIEPLALQTGQSRREHYAYEKNGACNLLAIVEPLTGKRLASVFAHRRKKEFCLFCQAVAAAYSQTIKTGKSSIHIMQLLMTRTKCSHNGK